jgi:rhodanese-related sulfurtransferase
MLICPARRIFLIVNAGTDGIPAAALIAAALLVALTVLCGCTGAGDPAVPGNESAGAAVLKDVSVHEAAFLSENHQQNDTFVILDVRTPGEYAAGAIAGSIAIDYRDPGFADAVSLLDRDATYLVYCKSGVRSKNASGILMELGFLRVYNLNGGFDAWTQAGYPTVVPGEEA